MLSSTMVVCFFIERTASNIFIYFYILRCQLYISVEFINKFSQLPIVSKM